MFAYHGQILHLIPSTAKTGEREKDKKNKMERKITQRKKKNRMVAV